MEAREAYLTHINILKLIVTNEGKFRCVNAAVFLKLYLYQAECTNSLTWSGTYSVSSGYCHCQYTVVGRYIYYRGSKVDPNVFNFPLSSYVVLLEVKKKRTNNQPSARYEANGSILL